MSARSTLMQGLACAHNSLQMPSNSSASARVRVPSTLSLRVAPAGSPICVMRVGINLRLLNSTSACKSYTELFHAAPQGRDGQAENLRRAADASDLASGVSQNLLDVCPLHLVHRNEPYGVRKHGAAVSDGFRF